MKKHLIIFLYLISITSVFSQNLSTEERLHWVEVLDSTYSWDRWAAIEHIYADSIYEAIPKLEEKFWASNSVDKCTYLVLLQFLNSPNARNFAYALVDSLRANSLIYTENDKVWLKTYLTDVLFRWGDYSTSDFIVEIFENYQERPLTPVPTFLLKDIYLNVPMYSQRAKILLIDIAKDNNYGEHETFSALYDLENLFGAQEVETYREILFSDTFAISKRTALENLIKYNYPSLDSLLKSNITQETNVFLRGQYVEIILKKYLTPQNAKWVKEYIPTEIDANAAEGMRIDLNFYKPKAPDSSVSVLEMINTLVTYLNEVYEYEWLKNFDYYNNLKSYTQSAINFLQISDSLNCAKEIKSFQESIEQVHADSAGNYPKYVNDDAYKFLYYYPQYILERLPEIPEDTTPEVRLLNSSGSPLTGGVCQYYEGGWKTATNNGDGTFSIETDKTSLSLRITYAYGTQTLSNVPWGTGPVIFRTVNTQVQLKDSENNLIDEGTVKYYAGGWRDFGTTSSGVAVKELLPNNYSFRMTYAYASNDKQQNLNDNTTVVFQTVLTEVQLKNSQGGFIDQGTVQYYSGGWRSFGATENGVSVLELLPNNYSFRMTYAFASKDKQQNLNDGTTVVFQTALATVQLKNSQGNFLDQGTVQYYSGGWRSFGATVNGVATLELLPNNYSFRMTYAFASNDKQQNIGTNPIIIFQTVPATVQLKDSQSNLIDQGTVQYYSGGWRNFGTTTNGIAMLELLPNNYSFRMTHEYISNDKAQNIGVNNVVDFSTVNCIIRVNNQQTQPVDGATISYYSDGWRQVGSTVNGEITKELMPRNLTFRTAYAGTSQYKTQDISTNNIIEFVIAQ